MSTNNKRKIFMSGIGGIGMSALAQLLTERGDEVSGSDRAESPVTELLTKKGIAVFLTQDAANIPEDIDILVYSDAVPFDNGERVAAREKGAPEASYFEMLGEVSEGMRTVAIAGTHGKTTTTGMLAAILRDAGVSPVAVVGSLVQDFGSNYLSGTSNIFVVEACEYKRHFLNLNPEILIITNVEFDHTDYFTDLADVQSAFKSLIDKVPSTGHIVADSEAPRVQPLLEGITAPVVTYTAEPAYRMSLLGEFNRMNARAASAAAKLLVPGITEGAIAASLEKFHGTWRRFEYKGSFNGVTVYDDYAHHPTAVDETLRALREKMDNGTEEEKSGKIIAVFHPHLYSRTRDLLDSFARSFGAADELIIVPIFAAREENDGTISSEILALRVRKEGVSARAVDSFADAESMIRGMAKQNDVVITMGAGDVYKVAEALVEG